MVDQYFVHYLLNKGVLTPAQMRAALEYERSVKVKMGILAINALFMTAAQVEEIHELQRTRDKQFGTLALERGYLTENQLEQLLTMQGKENLVFMQAVTDKGYLTLTELGVALSQYLKAKDITRETWISRDNDSEETIIKAVLDFSTKGEYSEYYYIYVGLLLRNIVRFLDGQAMVLPLSGETGINEDWLIGQDIFGSLNLGASLALAEPVLIEMASRFCGERLEAVNELALDSVGEFLNVHNGIFCGVLSQAGLDVDLQPQSTRKGLVLPGGFQRIHIDTSFGRINLVLH